MQWPTSVQHMLEGGLMLSCMQASMVLLPLWGPDSMPRVRMLCCCAA